uniref:Uncharacterized protein n=1 Tax=Oryza meridionalis TaxID=40149 RepID=A0A0E0ET00_9ORYZ
MPSARHTDDSDVSPRHQTSIFPHCYVNDGNGGAVRLFGEGTLIKIKKKGTYSTCVHAFDVFLNVFHMCRANASDSSVLLAAN